MVHKRKIPSDPGRQKRRRAAAVSRYQPNVVHSTAPADVQNRYDQRLPDTGPAPRRRPRPTQDVQGKLERFLAPLNLGSPNVISSDQFPFAVPCTLLDAGQVTGRPKYWAMGFHIFTEDDNRKILGSWDTIKAAEIKPSCKPSGRSKDGLPTYHAGFWFPVTRSKVPHWSKDGRHPLIQHLMETFAAIAGRAARKTLHDYDFVTYRKMTHTHVLSPLMVDFDKSGLAMTHSDINTTKLGRLGSVIAATNGQSEGWHFDRGDDDDTYSVVCVFGSGSWNNRERQGYLVIPQLNMEIELRVGDILFFQASHLAHYVRPLDAADLTKRMVITVFTCSRMSEYFEESGIPVHIPQV